MARGQKATWPGLTEVGTHCLQSDEAKHLQGHAMFKCTVQQRMQCQPALAAGPPAHPQSSPSSRVPPFPVTTAGTRSSRTFLVRLWTFLPGLVPKANAEHTWRRTKACSYLLCVIPRYGGLLIPRFLCPWPPFQLHDSSVRFDDQGSAEQQHLRTAQTLVE